MTELLGGARRAAAARRALTASLLALAALPLAAGAQVQPASPAQTRTIGFDEAIRIALERNPTLQLAENTAALDSVTVRQQKMNFFPDLRLNTSTGQSYGRNFSQDEGRIISTTNNSVTAGVSSSVTLFNGFQNSLQLNQARQTSAASEQEVGRARETVVFNVVSQYLTHTQQQEQLRVQEENLKAQEALLAQIELYVKAGARPISDLYQQQAQVASARLALVQTERALTLAKMDLIQTLQLDPLGDYEFQAPALSGSAGSRTADVAQLAQQALAQRVDLDAAEARLNAAEQGTRIARASRWPTVSLTAGYNSNYNSGADAAFLNQLNDRRGGSLGLSFGLPVFDRQASRLNSERTKIQLENARINLESLRQQVAIQVRRAYLDNQAAEAQLEAAEAQKRAADLALQTSQQRYDVGAATLVELTQARATQVKAASDLVSARYGLLFQGKVMDYYLGTLAATQEAAP